MNEQDRSKNAGAQSGRRTFLKRVAAAGGAVGVAAAGGAAVAEVRGGPDAPAKPAPESKGYRMTPHIAQYYKTARM